MPLRLRNVAVPPPKPPSENPTELELEQLVVDDSDGDGGENDTLTKTSSTNSALNVVRTKLARHMSNENETHRRSRASAGHSQEEVARRAELRRYRHQRIQEELKSEDNHAESSNTSHRSTSYLSPLIDAGQPMVGPRDTIEFTVADGPHSSAAPALPTQENTAIIDIPKTEVGSTTQEEGGEIKYPSILAVLTAGDRDRAPPLRPPSTHSNRSRKIAGCSYNSPRLDRVLGTDNEFDIRHGAHAWEEQSTLSIWLAAQGMRSRSSFTRATDNESSDKSARDQTCSHHQSFGAIDSAADAPLPIHCQGSNDMRPQNRGDSYESASFASNKSNTHTIGGTDTILPENKPLSGSNVLDIASAKFVDNSSSNYPSVLPSFQPSPNRSRPDFHHLSAQDLESLELSPFSWQGDFSVIKSIRASEGKSSYATAEDDIFYSDNNASSAQIIHPPAQTHTSTDATPIAGSTAAIFHPRETKARTIGTKLGNALSRRKPSASFGSRSKEEFHASSTGTGSRSLMSMINLSVPRRFKRDSGSFGTAHNRHCVNERDSSAIVREDPNDVRSGIPPHITSLFRPERSGLLSADLSDATIKNTYNHHHQTPLTQRHSATFETSRLTPHSDELPDEARSSSRRILQQLTANIQEAFSPSSTPKPTRPPESPNRLAKAPPHLGDERAAATDPRQSQLDGGSSISDALILDSGTRFQPAKLVKAMRSSFRKFMPSHDHDKQAQLCQPSKNNQHYDENEEHSQSKIVRLGTPSIESDHLKSGAKGTTESDTATSHQQLRVGKELEAPGLVKQLYDESDVESRSIDTIQSSQSKPYLSEEEEEAETPRSASVSTIRETRALRRWKSMSAAPTNRESSPNRVGRPISQSHSFNTL
ncbi:hypothetical protein TGAM01_v201135 [Trichoderma gamsii]|uniref:Uncharacterized protein n=1 Tax=Trichoderma gamsii TaxID=398673 RepID=A0A2P4ZZP0_9HYPO|nr:hypothetical protein TGAM01_v201135 [Trichoderma gamsii]PON29769.1 hypothetical protein TGAM01_v201135 [Trichoderma gamsii]